MKSTIYQLNGVLIATISVIVALAFLATSL